MKSFKALRYSLVLLGLSSLAASSWVAAGTMSALTPRQKRNMQRETHLAIDALQDYHYKKMSFVEVDSRRLLEDYFEALDDQHYYFLQDDIDFLIERFERTLKHTYLFVGDLYPAFEIYDLYLERINDRLDWIQERIQKDFDLDTDEVVLVDRAEEPWPQTKEEANAIWERRLKSEFISELLEDDSIDSVREKISKRYERVEKFVSEVEPHQVQETFLAALTHIYDPHTEFFSWDSARQFDIDITNSLTGIGAQLRDVDGYCVVESVLPGGPAEQSGSLHPGDRIVAVAQGDGEAIDVVGMKLRRIVNMIRGEIGTTVRLTTQAPASEKRKTISIVRDRIELAAQLAKGEVYEIPEGDGTIKIGVIEVPSFYGEGELDEKGNSTSRDIAELIEKLQKHDIQGLVLDLRQNRGGRLSEAIAVTGLFIEEGPVVMTRQFNGSVAEDWDRDKSVTYDGPLVVLTSKQSASASEITAGALQCHHRAVIVGEDSTFGKGTVQTVIDLRRHVALPFSSPPPEWGMIKITTQKYYLPDGASTQKKGVVSDIKLPSSTTPLLETEADRENALEWDSISPVSFEDVEAPWLKRNSALGGDTLNALRTRSLARQDSLEEFEFLNRQIAWRNERVEREEISLNLEKRKAQKQTDEEERKELDKESKTLGEKLKLEHEEVVLEVTEEQTKSHQAKLKDTSLPNGRHRANQFYQKVFYYQENEDSDIEEIWVEYIDYEEMLEHSEELAQAFSEKSGFEVSTEQMDAILNSIKNADRMGELIIDTHFKENLEETPSDEQMADGLAGFFKKVVELDRDIIDDSNRLDVHLREGLRIVEDWIKLNSSGTSDDSDIAAAVEKETEGSTPKPQSSQN